MATWAKLALLGAAVAAAVVLVLVLRPSGDEPAEETTPVEIAVRDGEVSGPERVELARGQQFVLVVQSDVADEVHVHGYDLMEDVAPGRPARFSFRVDDAGRFDVELEQRHQPLTELVVSP